LDEEEERFGQKWTMSQFWPIASDTAMSTAAEGPRTNDLLDVHHVHKMLEWPISIMQGVVTAEEKAAGSQPAKVARDPR
jgi:hypothetical protein